MQRSTVNKAACGEIGALAWLAVTSATLRYTHRGGVVAPHSIRHAIHTPMLKPMTAGHGWGQYVAVGRSGHAHRELLGKRTEELLRFLHLVWTRVRKTMSFFYLGDLDFLNRTDL